MRNLLLAGVSAFCVTAVAGAHATPMNGKMIRNVPIDAVAYNVTFLDESLSEVPSSFQFTFDTFVHASDAIHAIIATPDFANLTATANTTPGTYYSGFIVSYGTLLPPTSRPREYRGAVYQALTNTIDDLPLYYFPTNNINTTGSYPVVGYAVTAYALPNGQQLADLPEPASIAVVALGLFGVGALRRRG